MPQARKGILGAPPRPAKLRTAIVVLTALAALFYWPALRASAGIQFDAANLQYPVQKYIADRLAPGVFPFWTPYLYCGYPLTANPAAGAWYPLNWPFFAIGIVPRSIQWELAVHAWIALLGAYFFIARLVRRRAASLLGALAYAFSGFFTAQSGHPDLFMAAAWFPWLLLFYRRALGPGGLQNIAFGGLAGGLMLTAGSLAGAEFGFLGLALYAASVAAARRRYWKAPAGWALAIFCAALPVAAAALVPAWQLQALAAPTDFSAGVLSPRALLTLVYPNAWGAWSRGGTGRIMEHYLYAGILLLPLAVLGAWKTRQRAAGLALVVPTVWYMLGPYGGLYFIGRLIPGLQRFGPPVAGWFVAALGLSLLAAAGADYLARWWGVQRRFELPRGQSVPLHRVLPVALAAFLFADLWCCNMAFNPLAYARQSWAAAYGQREAVAQRQVVRPALPLNRFDAPGNVLGLGPAMHPLDLKFETTYGYIGPQLRTYRDYRAAMLRNPKLRDALNVNRYLSTVTQQIEYNPGVLPRAWFPAHTADVESEAQSLRMLEKLDPRALATVEAPHPGFYQDPLAEVNILRATEQSYLMHYVSRTPALLALSVAWYPGWRAEAQNRELPLVRVDHALLGVVVPTGSSLLRIEFQPERLGLGLWIGAAATLTLAGMAALGVAHARSENARRARKRRSTVS